MAGPASLPRIIQLQDGSYATPDGHGGWAPYNGALPTGTPGAPKADEFKIGSGDDISHAWDIVNSINEAQGLAGKPLATGTASAALTSVPVLGGLVGQPRADLQTKLGAIAGDLRQLGIKQLYQGTGQKGVGSIARTNAEQQALQNSLAPLGYVDAGGQSGAHGVVPSGAQPSPQALVEGLNTAKNIYYRHLAKLYNLNPDDPGTNRILDAAASDDHLRGALMQSAQAAAAKLNNPGASPPTGPAGPGQPPVGGSGAITPSSALPNLSVGPQFGSDQKEQAVTDPQVAKIKPMLEQMLNADPNKISNQQILDFVQQQGLDPSRLVNLENNLKLRMDPTVQQFQQKGYNLFSVDPHYNQPTSKLHQLLYGTDNASGGAALAAAAGDTLSGGAAPDVAGVVHSLTGLGPSRSDVVDARNAAETNHPLATLVGGAAGALGSPLGPLLSGGGSVGRTALQAAIYGGLSSDDPSISGRLGNAVLSGTLGTVAHGAGALTAAGATKGYRALERAVAPALDINPSAMADIQAVRRAAGQMPAQDASAMADSVANMRAAGANPPAAAALDRGGQNFLARIASSAPQASAAAEAAANNYSKGIPDTIAAHFNQAISDAAPEAPHVADFLDRPVRDVAKDVQSLAGREYETGMAPINSQPLAVPPELATTLTHERIPQAINDVLKNHNIDEETRNILRDLPGALKSSGEPPTVNVGGRNMTPEEVRAAFPNPGQAEAILGATGSGPAPLNLNVNGARNIATALDRTASKLQEGAEGQLQLRSLSRDIRDHITQQYPGFADVNSRYHGRMQSIDAMDAARRGFLGESPEQMDALAKATGNLTDVPNPPEYRGVLGAEPSGPVLPSNRQFATAGAREAATTAAGAGTGTRAPNILDQIANGPNQSSRNAMVLGPQADALANRAGVENTIGSAIKNVTTPVSGANDREGMFNALKRTLATYATGGVSHYAMGTALAHIPGISAADAERVTNIFLNSNSTDNVIKTLSNAYGAQRAKQIFTNALALGSIPLYQHGVPASVIGAPTPVGAH